jgi:hypothetical protein
MSQIATLIEEAEDDSEMRNGLSDSEAGCL